MDVLRIATAGSVDDGKSSLIGRLLYDTKSIFEDQFASIERASAQRGSDQVELALLTDGLRAEREQNITIDVAHRYFSTPLRKFIIADTPGHVQYTRNMVTGTSNADVSVVLVDATKGILPQSKRHAAISSLLRVPNLVIAINKMDLVEFAEARFNELVDEFRSAIERLGHAKLTFIPISALLGDNVVERSAQTPWYDGPTLLEFLEQVDPPTRDAEQPFRLAVQHVIRPGDGYRALAGTVASGSVRVGETITLLPSRLNATVKSLLVAGETSDVARAGEPVTLELAENVDASRGTLLSSATDVPTSGRTLEAVVCWLGDRPLEPGEPLILLHTTRRLGARVESVLGAVNVETLEVAPAQSLAKNDLGRVRIRLTDEIFAQPFAQHRELGSFVLADRGDFVTVAAGMVERMVAEDRDQRGEVLWFVGDPAELAAARRANGEEVRILTSEDLAELNADAPSDAERLRRIRAVARLFATQATVIVLIDDAAQITWGLSDRERVLTSEEVSPA